MCLCSPATSPVRCAFFLSCLGSFVALKVSQVSPCLACPVGLLCFCLSRLCKCLQGFEALMASQVSLCLACPYDFFVPDITPGHCQLLRCYPVTDLNFAVSLRLVLCVPFYKPLTSPKLSCKPSVNTHNDCFIPVFPLLKPQPSSHQSLYRAVCIFSIVSFSLV